MKKILWALIAIIAFSLALTGCRGDVVDVTVVLKNATDYEIKEVTFSIAQSHGSYSPMHYLVTAEDDPLKPGDEREVVTWLYESDFGNSGFALIILTDGGDSETHDAAKGEVTLASGTNYFKITHNGETFVITATDAADDSNAPMSANTEPDTPKTQKPDNLAALVTDFSGGNSDLNVEQYELGYSGTLTPEILIDGLSNLTGLDFIADTVQTEMGITVDWKNESTLIAGLDGREQKENFHFFDADSMRWFMMDSLYRTLMENFGDENIYYTMDGEKELAFEDLSPTSSFPSDIPYLGSPFYFGHADGRGFIYNEDEASSYLLDKLDEAGYDIRETAAVYEPNKADAWFGEMAVWYFAWGKSTPEKFTAEKHFAVTYDWEIWEYDVLNEEWSMKEE